jgi:hypothetical protein
MERIIWLSLLSDNNISIEYYLIILYHNNNIFLIKM